MAPAKTHDFDAGYDLTCSRYSSVGPGAKSMIPTNVAIDIPGGYFGLVLPRSSAFYRKGLIVHPGIIDAGYRGEVQILAYNPGPKTVYVPEGDRVAQILILPRVDAKFIEVEELTKGDRGQEGFGSTGGYDQRREGES